MAARIDDAGDIAFVGRDQELDDVTRLVREPHTFVTLSGPTGMGKTRLAAEAAERLAERSDRGAVIWVDAEAVPAAELVLPAVGQALGLHGELTRQTIQRSLRENVVVILDGVAPARAAAIEEVREVTGHVRILATSSAPLGLDGEIVVELLPPRDVERVFIEAGGDAGVDAGAVAELCRRLGGLPLALELAASAANELTASGLLSELDRQLAAKGDENPLNALLRVCLDLLDSRSRRAVRDLAVFADSWNPSAAEAVSAGVTEELLVKLAGRRLIRAVREGDPRYAMHEAIRAMALAEPAERGDLAAAQRRHAEWALALAEDAAGYLSGRRRGRSPVEVYGRLRPEANNFRAALVWAARHDEELLVNLVARVWRIYRDTSQHEARLWLDRVEDLIPAQPADVQKELLEGAGIIASETGDEDRAWQFAERAIALMRTTPDRRDLARALVFGGITAIGRNDLDRAAQLLEEGRQLGIEIDDPWSRAFGTFNLAEVRLVQGMYEETDALLEEAIEYFRGGVFGVGLSLVSRGIVALHQGRIDDARAFFVEAARLSSEHLGSDAGKARVMLMGALEGLAYIAVEERSLEQAARLFGAAEQLRDEGGFLEVESERFVRRPVQAALDTADDTLAAARAEGRAMDQAEAAAYALSTD